jgi:hypothetical protein
MNGLQVVLEDERCHFSSKPAAGEKEVVPRISAQIAGIDGDDGRGAAAAVLFDDNRQFVPAIRQRQLERACPRIARRAEGLFNTAVYCDVNGQTIDRAVHVVESDGPEGDVCRRLDTSASGQRHRAGHENAE